MVRESIHTSPFDVSACDIVESDCVWTDNGLLSAVAMGYLLNEQVTLETSI